MNTASTLVLKRPLDVEQTSEVVDAILNVTGVIDENVLKDRINGRYTTEYRFEIWGSGYPPQCHYIWFKNYDTGEYTLPQVVGPVYGFSIPEMPN